MLLSDRLDERWDAGDIASVQGVVGQIRIVDLLDCIFELGLGPASNDNLLADGQEVLCDSAADATCTTCDLLYTISWCSCECLERLDRVRTRAHLKSRILKDISISRMLEGCRGQFRIRL